METIGDRLVWYYVPFTDIPLPLGGVNVLTVFNTLVAMAVLWALLWLGVRKFAKVPGRGQVLVEMIVGAFDGLVESALELETREQNRRFFPLIITLFLLLLACNYVGVLPTAYFTEPTGDINTTLPLGIMGMTIATLCAIRVKGMGGYLAELCGPMFIPEEGAGTGAKIAGKLSALFFLPLNIAGELSKIVSISFRLFGNMIGGSIIIIVVSTLTYNLFVPIGLDGFFIFFQGAIQAFVFTMLTLTYVAVAIK